MLRPHCGLHTCNVAHTQLATFERVASKTRLDLIFCPWLIKYGGKSGFSLSNSVVVRWCCQSVVSTPKLFFFSVQLSNVKGMLKFYSILGFKDFRVLYPYLESVWKMHQNDTINPIFGSVVVMVTCGML